MRAKPTVLATGMAAVGMAALLMFAGCSTTSGTTATSDASGAPEPAQVATVDAGTGGEQLQAPVTAPTLAGADDPRPQASVSVSAPPPDDEDSTTGSNGTTATKSTTRTKVYELPPGVTIEQHSASLARDLAALANKARGAHSTAPAPLEWSACGASQATQRASNARGKSQLSHAPLGVECSSSTVGENLVRAGGSAARLHQLWMDSPTHRANILNARFNTVGIACVPYSAHESTDPPRDVGDLGGWLCSQMFYG